MNDVTAHAEAVSKLAEDAMRYRWLRAQHWNDNTITAVRYPKDAIKLGHDAPTGDRLDALIDEAMAVTTIFEDESLLGQKGKL